MKFCSNCGTGVSLAIPAGDTMPRYVCPQCQMIHYQNPKIVVGCIPEWEGKILLCRRAIEPRYGLWTLPAGYMENGETTPEAAIRETLEEAQARVEIESLYALFNLPHISQVYLMFRARLLEPAFGPGIESLEVDLYEEDDIPWDQLAFRAVLETLRFYFEDRRAGRFEFHMGDVLPVASIKPAGTASG